MQIHELNTFSGTPGETDFLAIDAGFDTAKISAPTLLRPLKSRIDSIASEKVNNPTDSNNQPDYGEAGQLLRTNGDGSTEWVDVGLPTDEQTAQAVSDWLGDHPEATTTVQDGSLTEAKFSEALKLETIKDYITPQMFGAAGDGVADDTNAINAALQYAYNNKINLIFPSGKYMISSTLNVIGADEIYNSSVVISGVERGSVEIYATAPMDQMLLVSSTGNYCVKVHISNLRLYGDEKADIGIKFNKSTSECVLENINILRCNNYGLHTDKNFYLNNLNRISAYNCAMGIYIAGGVNTSLNLNDCYVCNCTNGYRVSGIYSNMINCCADGITNTVFNLTGFRGALIGCGSEAYEALVMFQGGLRTQATIVGAFTFGNDTDENAIHVNVDAGYFNFIGGYIMVDRNYTDAIMPGKLFDQTEYGMIKFFGTRFSKYAKSASTSGRASLTHANTYTDFDSNVQIRYNDLVAFLGVDGAMGNGGVNPLNQGAITPANAIFFGLGDNFETRSDGESLSWTRKTSKGDILLSRNPENIGGIGWIQSTDTSQNPNAAWRTGTLYKIPVIHAGITAERPTTSLVIGQMFYDQTLEKPIWWNGVRWKDATGANV